MEERGSSKMRNKILLAVVAMFALSACETTGTNIVAEPVKPVLIHPAPPPGMTMRKLEWRVFNRQQLEEILSTTDGEVIIVGLTPKGYENLTVNMQEIIRYIREQKEVIIYYRKTYPTEDKTETK
jgi:hypothetical protein